MGDSPNWGYLLGGPHNKDYSILGSISGPPFLEKLPYYFGLPPATMYFLMISRE